MPPKSQAGNKKHQGGSNGKPAKSKKQQQEDDFEKLLAELNKATEQLGKEQAQKAERERRAREEREARHKQLLDKSKQNDVEEALMRRQYDLQLQQIVKQLMEAQSPFLRNPNTDFHGQSEKTNPHFDVAVGEMQGWRAQMEDDHVVDVAFPDGVADSKEGLFAVFDGHSGKQCAARCHTLLPEVVRSFTKKAEGSDYHEVEFETAYLELDNQLEKQLQGEEAEAGCTAVTVHVSPAAITCASVGDSRAVLCRNGAAFDLSHDHKPDLPEEGARITAAGGFVQDNRVNGKLAMSRAMGDFPYKSQKERAATEQLVIARPDVIRTAREEGDTFVALACDGIFDVMSNDELIAFILAKKEDGLENEKICEEVCRFCLAPSAGTSGQPSRAEGTDNMTIMIVDLK